MIITFKQKTRFTLFLPFLFVFGITVIIGCQSKKSLRDYYFPVDQLKDGLVYQYQSMNNEQLPPFFWYYKSFIDNGKLKFSGQYYNEEGIIQQYTLEEITDLGSKALKYSIFEHDSLGISHKAEVKIQKNQVFSFRQSEDILGFKINWDDPLNPTTSNTLNRGRVFKQWSDYDWNGQTIQCAEFLMVETIEVEDAGVQTLETTTKELFAKDIGLIYYHKAIGDKLVLEYELKERIPMSTFENYFGE